MGERRPPSELGAVLRRDAERHVPNRDAMLARIAQARSEVPHSRWSFLALRPVAAAASVVATLVVGFAGIRLATDRPEGQAPAANDGIASVTGAPPSPAPPALPTRPRSAGATTVAPRWTPVAGFLSSTAAVDPHSNATWAQSNLTLTTTETITELDVVVRVVRGEGVEDAGRWSSVPAEMTTLTTTEEKDALLYRFTLDEGRTLAPGRYVFASQYLHATGDRDPGGDTYVAVVAAGAQRAEVTGVFTAG